MIIQARLTKPQDFRAYAVAAAALVARLGGHYRVVSGATSVLEGSWPEVKTVISEWPDRASALAFWQCDEYAQVKTLREGTGEFNVVLIDGIDEPAPLK